MKSHLLVSRSILKVISHDNKDIDLKDIIRELILNIDNNFDNLYFDKKIKILNFILKIIQDMPEELFICNKFECIQIIKENIDDVLINQL